eukprot:3568683-Rhodomonas_salina.2
MALGKQALALIESNLREWNRANEYIAPSSYLQNEYIAPSRLVYSCRHSLQDQYIAPSRSVY